MTDKELRHLSRSELLETLTAQNKQIELMQAKIDELQAALDNRDIVIDRAGSIAEASMQLNGIFTAAQATADQYLDNIERIRHQTDAECARKRASCVARIREMQMHAQQEMEEYLSIVSARMKELRADFPEMEQILADIEKAGPGGDR